MRPADYIASLFKPSGGPGGESAAYDFDPIGSYFYNCPAEEGVFQIVDAETTADLDLNAVFEKIDRTTSRVGQQYLYARLRTLRGEEDAADFDRRVGAFENDDELMQRCAGHLARLAGDDAYDLCRLIFDTPVRVRRIGLIYALTAAATAALLLAPFYPALLLLFVAIYAVQHVYSLQQQNQHLPLHIGRKAAFHGPENRAAPCGRGGSRLGRSRTADPPGRRGRAPQPHRRHAGRRRQRTGGRRAGWHSNW